MSIFTQEEATFIRKLPEMKRVRLTGILFLYVFRGNRQSDIREALTTQNIEFDFLSWRLRLHTNGVMLRDGKIWMYGSYCRESLPFKMFDLTAADRVFINYALRYKPLLKRLWELSKVELRPVMGLKGFDRFAGEVLSSDDLHVYVAKFMRKKMSFLNLSYNISFDEIESDLMGWAHYALLRSYPRFDDIGHGLAVAKTTVKRRGVNLIKTMTTQRSNALITREDGKCERTTVSMSNIADGTGQFLTADGTFIHRSFMVVGIDGVNSSQNSIGWETQRAIRELLSCSALNDKHKAFMNLMLGEQDEAFSDWLGESNEDVIERMDYSAYTQKVCAFLGLSQQRAASFLESLKPHLGGTAESQL